MGSYGPPINQQQTVSDITGNVSQNVLNYNSTFNLGSSPTFTNCTFNNCTFVFSEDFQKAAFEDLGKNVNEESNSKTEMKKSNEGGSKNRKKEISGKGRRKSKSLVSHGEENNDVRTAKESKNEKKKSFEETKETKTAEEIRSEESKTSNGETKGVTTAKEISTKSKKKSRKETQNRKDANKDTVVSHDKKETSAVSTAREISEKKVRISRIDWKKGRIVARSRGSIDNENTMYWSKNGGQQIESDEDGAEVFTKQGIPEDSIDVRLISA